MSLYNAKSVQLIELHAFHLIMYSYFYMRLFHLLEVSILDVVILLGVLL